MTRRRKRAKKVTPQRRDWKTNVWYLIGALIVLTMVFSLVAGAFSSGRF